MKRFWRGQSPIRKRQAPKEELEIGRTEKISLRKTTYTKRLTPTLRTPHIDSHRAVPSIGDRDQVRVDGRSEIRHQFGQG